MQFDVLALEAKLGLVSQYNKRDLYFSLQLSTKGLGKRNTQFL